MLKPPATCMLLLLVTVGSVESRPFTAKDLALQERVSDPHISPDGRFVAYNVRSTDWDANRGLNALWILDREGPGAPPRLIRDQEKSATQPRWSADGRWLYFLSARSGSSQVWRVSPVKAETRQMTDLPLDVGFYRVGPDERHLVLTAIAYSGCHTLACSKAKDDGKARQKPTGTLYDSTPARFWDTYFDGRYVRLFAVTIDGDTPATDGVSLTPDYEADVVDRPEGDESSFVISPDGRSAIFSARPSGSAQGMGDPRKLYTVSLDGSAPPARIDPTSSTSDSNPALSNDGLWLAYLSQRGSTFTAPRATIMIRDFHSGATRELTTGFALSAQTIAWSADSKTIYGVAEDTGQRRIFAFNAKTGAAKPLTADGHVGSLDVGRRAVVFSRDSLDAPAQVFELAAGGKERMLSHVGLEGLAQTPMSAFEPFSFVGWNNENVHGYIVKPTNFQLDRKYPVAFLIHGGPHGTFANAWSYRWNPQVWAGMGYAVVMIDFHGSSGYGEGFAKSIVGHWGDRPLEDLQSGWTYALSHFGFLDGDRACALGGSYGGYMIAWIAGTWAKPWKCLVDHDGVFDMRLMSYSSDIPGFSQEQNMAQTWVQPDAVERFNPIDHVADWTVPILVIHGGRDVRVPLDQGMGAYGAAQLRQVPSQLLYFPDENHWVLKPQNSVQWYATVEAWMKRWLER